MNGKNLIESAYTLGSRRSASVAAVNGSGAYITDGIANESSGSLKKGASSGNMVLFDMGERGECDNDRVRSEGPRHSAYI